MENHIIPECYIDTKLIKVLVPAKKYNHQKGCPKVVGIMQTKFTDKFALGIIDKDKRILKYTQEFDIIHKVEGKLELLKHPQKHHFIIYICPAVENSC